MSSESVAESSVSVSAAATVEAGKKRGRLPAGQVTIKLDADTRLHRWNELSSDIAIGNWLDVSHEAKHVFMTSERTMCIVCCTTKQFSKLSNTRLHADSDSHKDSEAKVASRVEEKVRRMAALRVVAVPENLRPHEVSPHIPGWLKVLCLNLHLAC